MKQALIIHHADDNDGIFSAAIAQIAVFEKYSLEYDTLGLDYNQVNILVSGGEVTGITFDDILNNYEMVCLVDLSFPVPFMLKLRERYGDKFIWNDHHAPIIAAMKETGIDINGIQDSSHSALYNCWMFWFAEKEIPEVLYELQRYDSWTFDESTRERCTFINSACNTIFKLNPSWVREYVYDLMDPEKASEVSSADELQEIGRILSEEESRKDENMIRTKGDLTATVDGRPACFLVHGYPTGSRTFEYLKGSGIEHGVVLKRNSDGTWVISLYNIEDDCDFHCGDYCRAHYNGGGHKGAAGGQISEDRALELIKTRKF